jgi:uncharacterized protein YndB with AHSA1/START domain/uncharacterized glyoxalase superfamily protein PhnB
VSERNSVDLHSDPLSIIGSRVFDAPRELVFDVWTDPKHLAKWWGPDGFSTTTRNFEFKKGGVWRFVMHGPDGHDYENRITYDEIVRPERIAYHHGGGDVEPVQFRSVVTFEELGGKTRVTLKGTFPTEAERARVIAEYGADKGMVQTLSRLGHYVEVQSKGDAAMQNIDNEPVFTTSRIFDAPRDLVWAAWTDAKHLMHWFGPKGFEVTTCDLDLRPGGVFHYALRGPDGKTMWGKWIFREIQPPRELVVAVSFSDERGGVTRHPLAQSWPLTTLSVMTFEEVGHNKTKITLRWTPLNPTEEERKTFAAGIEGMKQGWGGTMDQLAGYLAKAQSSGHSVHLRETAMNTLNTYLHFAGNCEEAFRLYEKVLHGKNGMKMTFADAPAGMPTTPEMKNKVMHQRIQVGNNILMGSDAPPDRYKKPQGFSVSYNCETAQEAERVYGELSPGGHIDMALQETFWAQRFAMFTDKFGTPWMINCEKPM